MLHHCPKCPDCSELAVRQVYSVRGSPLCLTGTAEVPLAAVAMDAVLSEGELPLRLAAFGHCFRTEAGAAGATLPALCFPSPSGLRCCPGKVLLAACRVGR